MQRPVVQRLLGLIRFRNDYDAFDGSFHILDSDDSVLNVSWERGRSKCQLMVDFECGKGVIRYADDDGNPVDYPL